MIRIENLVKSYDYHEVLKGITLEVKKGEIYGFIGPNGAGKSTTMNILAGLIDYQSGKCIVKGREVKKNINRQFRDIGYLPEDPRFYPYMNAREYLSFIGTMGGDTVKIIRKKTEWLLDMVKLTKVSKRPIGTYSRGMRQRLGIAVAMYHDPEVLLLDEPSSALDPEGRKDVIEIIQQLKNHKKTVFLSTHILNDIERICDRIGILHEGKIVVDESLEILMNRYLQPIYDIEFKEVLNENQIDTIKTASFVEQVTINGKNISLVIKDMDLNGKNVLKLLAKTEMPIISMNMRKPSLEDIFMKVVK